MSTVGADVDQMRAAAKRLTEAADQLQSSVKGLNTVVSNPSIWRGNDAEQFRSEWKSQSVGSMNSAISALRSGADALRRNADQQEAASRADGGAMTASNGGAASECYEQSANGLTDLWKEIQDTPNGWDPTGPDMSGYRVQRVMVDGVEKYIVYIGGTVLAGTQNWGANVSAISGRLDDAQVKALERLIPPGAEVMLVGYSQGGIDAQNIAESGRLNVKQIVTFGSPIRNDINIPAIHLQDSADVVTSSSAVNPTLYSSGSQSRNDNVEVFQSKPHLLTVFGIGEHIGGYGGMAEDWDSAAATKSDTRASSSAEGLKAFQGDIVGEVDIDAKGQGSW